MGDTQDMTKTAGKPLYAVVLLDEQGEPIRSLTYWDHKTATQVGENVMANGQAHRVLVFPVSSPVPDA